MTQSNPLDIFTTVAVSSGDEFDVRSLQAEDVGSNLSSNHPTSINSRTDAIVLDSLFTDTGGNNLVQNNDAYQNPTIKNNRGYPHRPTGITTCVSSGELAGFQMWIGTVYKTAGAAHGDLRSGCTYTDIDNLIVQVDIFEDPLQSNKYVGMRMRQ